MGRTKWEGALRNGKRAHGILGFEKPSLSDYQAYDDDFMDELGARHSIITSWINANSGIIAIDQPYGIVYHSENLDDKFQRPSEGISLTADQTTDDFSYFWRDENGSIGIDRLESSCEATVEHEIQWRGKSFKLKVQTRSRSLLPRVLAKVHKFNINLVISNFDLWREWGSGIIRLSKDWNIRSTEIDKRAARELALAFVKQCEFPLDAQISDIVAIRHTSTNVESRIPAYVITFTHDMYNYDISGDYIKLIVQNDGVKFCAAFWHDVMKESENSDILPQFKCDDLQRCIDWYGQTFDASEEPPNILAIKPAFYVGQIFDSTMVHVTVVWCVHFSNGALANYIPNEKKVVCYKTELDHQRKRCVLSNHQSVYRK